jgi:hypothetical protein
VELASLIAAYLALLVALAEMILAIPKKKIADCN